MSNSLWSMAKNSKPKLKVLLRSRKMLEKAIQDEFDPEFYKLQVPEIASSDTSFLIKHFLDQGSKSGLDPNSEFSVSLYRLTNEDVSKANVEPFSHYLIEGRKEGRQAFLSNWAVEDAAPINSEQLSIVIAETQIDYLRSQLEEKFNSLSDRAVISYFLNFGNIQGLNPTPLFDTRAYLSTHTDVAEAKQNAFLHFIIWGRYEQRQVQKTLHRELEYKLLGPTEENLDSHKAIAAPFFDKKYYTTHYPDMTNADIDYLEHYLLYGWKEGRNPSKSFVTSEYLTENPTVRESGTNPLVHYALGGSPSPRITEESSQVTKSKVSKQELDAVRSTFDASFYRLMNEDLDGDDESLLIHYMAQGWKERRDPCSEFSTSYYLDNYPDISENEINPLLHYVLFGKREGRRARGNEPSTIPFNSNAKIVPEHLSVVIPEIKESRGRARPPKVIDVTEMHIHWVIPDFSRGSGGHMTIFRIIRHLENLGHKCYIWIEKPRFNENCEQVWEEIIKYFQCVEAPVKFVQDGFFNVKGDIAVATGWSTAYIVERASGFAGKFYFVQDHEPEFYPTGTEYLLARDTYSFELDCICASPWLERLMSEKYGRWARHFYLAFDNDVYKISDESAHKIRHSPENEQVCKIAVYARDHTARRCVNLALMALQSLGQKRQDFEVHFFGQEKLPFTEANFKALNHGVLNSDQLAELYNDCHIGICFSATNYSLVPQEMMACGLPLLEIDGDSTRSIFPNDIITLGGPNPADITEKLTKLIEKPRLRGKQASAANKWVREFSWEGAAKVVESAINERMMSRVDLKKPAHTRSRESKIDVVIPTFNGIGQIESVIQALRQQRNSEEIQIFCVDSSSTDGTTEWLKEQRDISTTVIDQEKFQHGRTRNDGASLGKAALIAFLTQDAIPANDSWSSDIGKMFRHAPDAAGLFGRHIPYPNHPEYVRQEINSHFESMLKYPLALSKNTDRTLWDERDQEWRKLLHFYSDNNSAMRRDIWNIIPYPEIDYGEDQVWARDIIDAGYTKLYSPTACVFHSHDYDPKEIYKRSKIEGAFFYRHFGYELGGSSDDESEKLALNEQAHLKKLAWKLSMSDSEYSSRISSIREKYRGLRDGQIEAKKALAQLQKYKG